jgi:hypothetical protein
MVLDEPLGPWVRSLLGETTHCLTLVLFKYTLQVLGNIWYRTSNDRVTVNRELGKDVKGNEPSYFK